MPVQVRCPNADCGKTFFVADELVGKTARCKGCSQPFALKPVDDNGAVKEVGEATTAKPPAKVSKTSTLGRFQVKQRLGAGAFGAVYLAYDPQLERDIALKVPQPGMMDTPKRVERFLREAKAAAQLRHPHIVPVFETGRDHEQYFIASAFIEGQPLAGAIGESGMECERAARIVLKLADALEYAHGLGIVHRDIKPANVMLDKDDQPLLMDFGLAARAASTEKLTQDGTVLGTPAYMAPEQAAGQQGEALPESDQYSLGVVLYELLTGKTPFEGPPQVVLYNVLHQEPPAPRTLRKDIPRDLETICLKSLNKKPERRYADCQALAADLRRWLDGEPIRARRPGLGERVLRWLQREPKLAAAGALALLGAVALAIGLGITANKLSGEVGDERVAHGKTKKTLGDEQADHKLTKNDRYVKQVGLAKEQIDGHDLKGGFLTLAACPADLRGWEWGHLRLLADGSSDALRVLNGKGQILHVHFTSDSKQLISVQPQGTRMAWDLASDKAESSAEPLKLEPWSGSKFSADGTIVATLQFAPPLSVAPNKGPEEPAPAKGADVPTPAKGPVVPPPHKLQIRDLVSNKLLTELTVPPGSVYGLSPDGGKIAVASAPKFGDPFRITVYDAKTGQELHKLDGTFTSTIALIFSPDGTWLAIVQGGGIFVTKKLVAKEVQELQNGKTVTRTVYEQVEETHMGKGIGLKVVATATGQEKLAVTKDVMGVSGAAFTPDGKRLYFLQPDGATVYDLSDAKELFTLPGRIGAIAFSPDGKRVATAASGDACPPDGLVTIWDATTGQSIVSLRASGFANPYDRLLFSPDGAWLAAVPFNSSQIYLFSTGDGRLLTPYFEHGCPVDSVTWSPDGKLVSSWSSCGQTARVWDATNAKTAFVAPAQFTTGLGFTTDGTYLTSGGGCLGAAPHGGYGAYGGYGCYGIPNMGGVNVFNRADFKSQDTPKGFQQILAATRDGKRWLVKPNFDKNKFIDGRMPGAQLFDVPGTKALHAFEDMDMNGQARFTDDGTRVYGNAKAMADITRQKTAFTKEKRTKTVATKKNGKTVNETVDYEVNVPTTVQYTARVYATHLSIYDADAPKPLLRIGGVDDLFAISADGKLVATLPPPEPPQPMKMPAPPAAAPPNPKEGVPVPVPLKTAGASDQKDAGAYQFVALQPKKLDNGSKQPDAPDDAPDEPFVPPVPQTPVTVWIVDKKDQAGTPQRLYCLMPGRVASLNFSPDGRFLAAYTPHALEFVPETHTKNVEVITDGKKTMRPATYCVITKREFAILKVFETATGKEVLNHVGASGLALFSPDSSRLVSASGTPVVGAQHFGAPMGGEILAPPPSVVAPAPAPAPTPGPPATFDFGGPGSPKALHQAPWQVASAAQEPPALPAPVLAAPAQQPMPVVWNPGAGHKSYSTELRVFDLKSGKVLHKLFGHTGPVTALAFTPDNQKLASGSYGVVGAYVNPPGSHLAQILIWEVTPGKLFQTCRGHSGRINCLDFAPDGKSLASASDDTTAKVWRVAPTIPAPNAPTAPMPGQPPTLALTIRD